MSMLSRAALVLMLLVACGSPPGSQARSASAARLTGSPASASSGASQTLTGSYGILVTQDHVLLISPDATIAASVPIANPSLAPQACGNGMGAWTLPGVSASNHHVYFRDGDTKIRMVVPPSSAVDVTTVPGGSTVISGFSVSPDDRRIAVSVERFSASGISDALYVEDLRGHTHRANIYSATAAAGKVTTMLWPMGWHGGELVLAVWAACAFELVPYPNAWHVADATTAVRRASIGGATCSPGVWPSPAGVACFQNQSPGAVRVYDWTGKLETAVVTDAAATELSPSGRNLAAGSSNLGGSSPSTTMLGADGSGVVTSPGHQACLWIDDSHLLAFDAVIDYPSGAATALPAGGQCAGRFPGGL